MRQSAAYGPAPGCRAECRKPTEIRDPPLISVNSARKRLDVGTGRGRRCSLAFGSVWFLASEVFNDLRGKVIRGVCARFGGLLVILAWAASAAHAGYDYPARPYLEQNLARAADRFPGDLAHQRCWAATNAVWEFTLDQFGPDHAEAWLAPWWHDGQWRKLCDGEGLRSMESRHWGITCPYRSCPEGEGPYISINHDRIYSGQWPESWLHGRFYYVMAHEMAHAIGHYYGDPNWADDHWADGVARAFGAAVCSHSPYCRRGPPHQKSKSQTWLGTLVVPPRVPSGDRTQAAASR